MHIWLLPYATKNMVKFLRGSTIKGQLKITRKPIYPSIVVLFIYSTFRRFNFMQCTRLACLNIYSSCISSDRTLATKWQLAVLAWICILVINVNKIMSHGPRFRFLDWSQNKCKKKVCELNQLFWSKLFYLLN